MFQTQRNEIKAFPLFFLLIIPNLPLGYLLGISCYLIEQLSWEKESNLKEFFRDKKRSLQQKNVRGESPLYFIAIDILINGNTFLKSYHNCRTSQNCIYFMRYWLLIRTKENPSWRNKFLSKPLTHVSVLMSQSVHGFDVYARCKSSFQRGNNS